MNQDVIKQIVDNRDYHNMYAFGKLPAWGEYVLTGLQAGNLDGEKGWHLYVGYVVQIRKKAGAHKTDLILLRHPDGTLMAHHNQTFHKIQTNFIDLVKSQYPEGMTPDEYENMDEPYTLADEFPEIGKVIEPKEERPNLYEGPMMKITIEKPDGSKIVEVV